MVAFLSTTARRNRSVRSCACENLLRPITELGWVALIHVEDMAVSKNSGTPKSSILKGFSIINHPFWDTPIFGNTHIIFMTGDILLVSKLMNLPYLLHRSFLHIVSDRVSMFRFLFEQSSYDALRICRFYVDDRSTCKQESSPPTFSGSLNYNTRDHCTATLPKLQSLCEFTCSQKVLSIT